MDEIYVIDDVAVSHLLKELIYFLGGLFKSPNQVFRLSSSSNGSFYTCKTGEFADVGTSEMSFSA